jgi:hypothetical protein
MILLKAPLFVLVDIIDFLMPQSDRMSDKQAGLCRLVFLLQLFQTKRMYNVSR